MTADKPRAICGKLVALGLRCNRQPNHPTGCRWEAGPTSKDKPEAGRTCANWKDCGKFNELAGERLYCSFECRDAGRPLNTAQRTEPAGLYRKFVVERTNGSSGPGGKHEHCDYFVLDWMHDKFAIPAALAYAKACDAEYPELARDLRDRAGAAVAHAEPARKIPLNPAPRPVEPRVEVVSEGPPTRSLAEILRDPPKLHLSPSPVERCSCPEATRYKAALERIVQMERFGDTRGTIYNIARRALALGGETDNG